MQCVNNQGYARVTGIISVSHFFFVFIFICIFIFILVRVFVLICVCFGFMNLMWIYYISLLAIFFYCYWKLIWVVKSFAWLIYCFLRRLIQFIGIYAQGIENGKYLIYHKYVMKYIYLVFLFVFNKTVLLSFCELGHIKLVSMLTFMFVITAFYVIINLILSCLDITFLKFVKFRFLSIFVI